MTKLKRKENSIQFECLIKLERRLSVIKFE